MPRDAVTVTTEIAAPADIVSRFLTAERAAWWPDMRFEAVIGSPLVETWIEHDRQRRATGTVTRCEALADGAP